MSMDFEVLYGGKNAYIQRKQEIRKKRIESYKNSYFKYKYGLGDKADNKKTVYFGILYFARADAANLSTQQIFLAVTEMMEIKMLMQHISLQEIMQLFPIIKEYDGKKFECKDYISTMEYLSKKQMNECFETQEDVDMFFWNYYNSDIMNFSIKETLFCSELLKRSGRKGLLESFFDKFANGEIHTYTMDKKNNVMIDNKTGETFKINESPMPKIAKYFEVINSQHNGSSNPAGT